METRDLRKWFFALFVVAALIGTWNRLPLPASGQSSTQGLCSNGVRCPNTTNLLFTFATNQLGFDTGLAIANTTADPFGTPNQTGKCTLNFYGTNPPANPVVTGDISAGTDYTTIMSSSAPGFQGYIIAQCKFGFAHGMAFVSDLGARNLAFSVPAIVMDKGANQRPVVANNPGEGFDQ